MRVTEHGPRLGRPASGWEALTATERLVAELVVQGDTNAEIAHQLGMAVTTVKVHLRRIYTKVGVKNRTSLAAKFHRGNAL